MQAEPLQIGDQVGDHALEDALTLAQDVELRQKEKDEENTTSGSGRSHDTSTDPFPLPIAGRSPLSPRDPHLVKHLKELGTGLVDGADDSTAPLGQRLHEGHHLETGSAVQTTVQREATRGRGEVGRDKGRDCLGGAAAMRARELAGRGSPWPSLYPIHTVRFRHLEVPRSPEYW